MLIRFIGILTLLCCSALLSSCDPQALVKEKVPDVIKGPLTFTEQAASGPGGPEEQTATAEILSPKRNQVYSAAKDVQFAAKASIPGQEKVVNDAFQWKLMPVGGGKAPDLGKGPKTRKKLEPGEYRVRLAVKAGKGNEVVKNVKFKVAHLISGVVNFNDKGLPGTVMKLTDLKGEQEFGTFKTNQKGEFDLQIPPSGTFRVVPDKKGFSFEPVYKIVRYKPNHPELIFRGAKGEIRDIRLLASPDASDPLSNMCPGVRAYLDLFVQSDSPVTRLSAFLVPEGAETVPPILLEEVTEASAIPQSAVEQKAPPIPVVIPEKILIGRATTGFGLRVTAYDEKNNAFTAETPPTIESSISQCVAGAFADAVALHEQDNLESAIEAYSKIADIQEGLSDSAAFAGYMEKTYFNRALANLKLALDAGEGDLKRTGYLGKAQVDLNEALRFHSRDADAFMLLGLVHLLKGDTAGALENLNSAINLNPQLETAYLLRARTQLRTGIKDNLASAVDDFTQSLMLNPSLKGVRESRGATLQLDLRSKSQPAQSSVVTSTVPLTPLEQQMDLSKYLRK